MRFEKDIKIIINQEILEIIKNCVKKASPNEACGLIFGNIKERENPVLKGDFFYHYNSRLFKCIESTEKSPVAFIISNFDELYKISRDVIEYNDLKLISIFHSHPSGPYPSGVDIHYMSIFHNTQLTKFKHILWTIMDASNFEINGFLYIKKELIQVDVQIK